ncbi:MAG: NAD-dependent epimerase/dehydratase family protein [Candidatus Daviesbacteria bacterium]|nr:NAD-dependent epimerase/dehydratase family protein [Candidatus Daviesbacteria bacterium]
MKKTKKVLVTGAGGFIGHHLVTYLRKKGYWVRGVDLKLPEYKSTDADEFLNLDLREKKNALKATEGMDHVYALAADMGGMGFISKNHATILYNNATINLNTIEAARINKVGRYFYSSSACIYPEYRQIKARLKPLKEEDAFPAQPQDAYGWEKLVTEILAGYYYEEHGLETRIARFHNIFGPYGTWDGGREKAPAAICRKVAIAKLSGKKEIEIWGDGKQTRSFCYIDDCLNGIYKLMMSNFREPLNIGQDRMVTIDQLMDIVSKAAGVNFKKNHIPGPQGVRGRNSDNTKLRKVLKWEPEISLEEGLEKTYKWIEEQVKSTIIK